MDKEFNTTFIPKKAPVSKPVQVKRPVGFLSIFAALMFFLSIAGFVGVFAYERILDARIQEKVRDIQDAQADFDEGFLAELKELDVRLKVSADLLSRHVAVAPFVRTLEDRTIPSIQYDEFDFGFEDDVNSYVVTMSGQALSYKTIAQQSSIFGTTDFISEHIFSDFILNDEGRVEFALDLVIDPELIRFEKSLMKLSDFSTDL